MRVHVLDIVKLIPHFLVIIQLFQAEPLFLTVRIEWNIVFWWA